MKLYLMQHGEAKTKEEDPERPLTDKGNEDVRRIAKFVQNTDVRITEIRHSGKLRAKQTADILGEYLTPKDGVAALSTLGPNEEAVPMARALSEEDENVMLVGHLPFMQRLVAVLVAGESCVRPVIHFRKGGLICLERDAEGTWEIAYFITPDFLP